MLLYCCFDGIAATILTLIACTIIDSLRFKYTSQDKNAFMFMAAPYAGNSCVRNVFHTGGIPNQFLEPSLDYMFRKFCSSQACSVFLLGSDIAFTRNINLITRYTVSSYSATVSGELVLPLGTTRDMREVVALIQTTLVNGGIIIDSLHDSIHVSFLSAFKNAGLSPSSYRILAIGAQEIVRPGSQDRYLLEEHFAVSTYFPESAFGIDLSSVKADSGELWRPARVRARMCACTPCICTCARPCGRSCDSVLCHFPFISAHRAFAHGRRIAPRSNPTLPVSK